MAISSNIPGTIRVPSVLTEVDPSNAVSGPQLIQYKRLLMGQMLAAGSATANTLVRITSAAQAATLFGTGSMLHGMALAAFAQDTLTETWVMPVADNGSGTAATGTIVVSGPATESGTISLYIAGRLVQVGVTSGDSANDIATAIEAAVDAMAGADALPVTAGVSTNTVTLTARHKGTCGNDIDVRVNYQDGEETPAGVDLTITAMASGATNPTLTTAIANLGDEWFHIWAIGWTDSTSLSAIEGELEDRFGYLREIEGHAFAGYRGNLSALGTLGNARNSPHLTVMQSYAEPMPAYEKAAETAAIAARYAAIDPARPVQNLPYSWCLPAAQADRFTFEERNILLYDGIATSKVEVGTMYVERLITTYKTNAAGADDTAYLDFETMATLMFIRHDWRDYIKRKYPRHKLADDGNRAGPGQAIMTPKLGKAEYMAKCLEWEEIGLVENLDEIEANTVFERNISDPNRLDALLGPDLVNQLRVIGNTIAFRL